MKEISADQYAGGGVAPASGSAGAGQADVFEPQHVLVFKSQHCTPPASAGQVFAQSASVAHVAAHFFSGAAGVLAGVDDGGTVEAGGGVVDDVSGGAVSSGGTSALFAQAASAAARATR